MKLIKYCMEPGKETKSIIEEIKDMIKRNPEIQTHADYDARGNYIINLQIPNRREIKKLEKQRAMQQEQMQENIDHERRETIELRSNWKQSLKADQGIVEQQYVNNQPVKGYQSYYDKQEIGR